MTTSWFVSDLHLDLAPDDGIGEVFVAFVHAVVRAGATAGDRLVLLGDTLELAGYAAPPGLREDWAVNRLDLLADRHAAVFDALRACLADGIGLDVVPGNHDVDLARPRVRRHLTRLLGTARCGPRVHTWALYEPGVFLAGHGHQHHDLSRFPTLLAAARSGPEGELPAPPLAALGMAGSAATLHRAGTVLRAMHRSRRGEATAAGATYSALLDAEAARLALPAPVVHQLAAVSRFRWPRVAARLAVTIPGRRLGLVESDGYLRRAAVRTHAVLSRHGVQVPFLLFGHTHCARGEALPGTDVRYLNCGTWSSYVHGHDAAHRAHRRFPYAVVEHDEERTRAGLRYWDADAAATTGGPPVVDPRGAAARD